MGHRGCRLAVTYPEIAAMQTRAVIKAALNVSAETGCMITPHIMIPLVGEVKELKFVKDLRCSFRYLSRILPKRPYAAGSLPCISKLGTQKSSCFR